MKKWYHTCQTSRAHKWFLDFRKLHPWTINSQIDRINRSNLLSSLKKTYIFLKILFLYLFLLELFSASFIILVELWPIVSKNILHEYFWALPKKLWNIALFEVVLRARRTCEIVSLSLSSHYRYRIRLIAAESIDASGTCSRDALQRRYSFPQAAWR